MAAWPREELLVYGYIKEYHKANNMDLPPNDLILLFVSWIALMDSFDKNMIPEDIIFDPEIDTKFKREAANDFHSNAYASVIGTIVVEKGMKQNWTFKVHGKYPLIGIIKEQIIKSKKMIKDFTDEYHNGYGIQTAGDWNFFHGNVYDYDGGLAKYVEQFQLYPRPVVITMQLDMTQTENENGILKYIIHNEIKEDIKHIRTDGEYTNIAYNNININDKYRLAFAISNNKFDTGAWCQLVPDIE